MREIRLLTCRKVTHIILYTRAKGGILTIKSPPPRFCNAEIAEQNLISLTLFGKSAFIIVSLNNIYAAKLIISKIPPK